MALAGAKIYLDTKGTIHINEGIVLKKDVKALNALLTGKPLKAAPKDPYTKKFKDDMAVIRQRILRAALTKDQHLAQQLLLFSDASALVEQFHPSGINLPTQASHADAEDAAHFKAGTISEAERDIQSLIETADLSWACDDIGTAFEKFLALSDDKKRQLATLCAISRIVPGPSDPTASKNPHLHDVLAQRLNLKVRDYWRPSPEWLQRRTKPQLIDLLKELSGSARSAATLASTSKANIVQILTKIFDQTAEAYPKACKNAKAWQPEIMAFCNPRKAPITNKKKPTNPA